MKIAQVDVNFQHSSTGKIVADLMSGLTRNGHEVIACYGRGPNTHLPNVHKIASSWEVAVHALATRVTGLTGIYSPLATQNLIRTLADFQPDVVHLHDLHGYFLNISTLVAYLKRVRVPVVWTFHSEFMYTGKCGYAFDCTRWQSECHHCPRLREYPISWHFDFTTRMFREKRDMFKDFPHLTLAAPSEWLAERIRRSVIAGSHKVHVIYNGLDDTVFVPGNRAQIKERLGISQKKMVLAVGSNLMSELKGGHWVVQLATQMQTEDVLFVMIGVGNTPTTLPKNVTAIAQVTNQQLLADYYSAADVLLLTSARETFSMVTAESLACGTPVIGFDSMAPKEVAPSGYGQFVAYGDAHGLRKLLDQTLRGTSLLKEPYECAAFARARYAKSAMVTRYTAIYEQVTHVR